MWIYIYLRPLGNLSVWHLPSSWLPSYFYSPGTERESDTLQTKHCHLNNSLSSSLCCPSEGTHLSFFFLIPFLPPFLSLSFCWRWQLILWPSFILATANFGENKNPAPLIRLEGLQIEFSPSQCPLSWLSLGAKAGPWRWSKHQLTEFEMLESWQAEGGNWRAVGIL